MLAKNKAKNLKRHKDKVNIDVDYSKLPEKAKNNNHLYIELSNLPDEVKDKENLDININLTNVPDEVKDNKDLDITVNIIDPSKKIKVTEIPNKENISNKENTPNIEILEYICKFIILASIFIILYIFSISSS